MDIVYMSACILLLQVYRICEVGSVFGLTLAVNQQKGVILVMRNHLLQTAKKLKDKHDRHNFV